MLHGWLSQVRWIEPCSGEMVRTQAHRGTPAGYGPIGGRGADHGAASRRGAAPDADAGGAGSDRLAAASCDADAGDLEAFRRKGDAMKAAHPPRKGCGAPASSPDADPLAGPRRGCGGRAVTPAADLLAGKGVAGGYLPAGTLGTGSVPGSGVAAGAVGSMASSPGGPGATGRIRRLASVCDLPIVSTCNI